MEQEKSVHVTYFARLKAEVGKTQEVVQTNAKTVGELLDQLRGLYRFSLSKDLIRAALNQKLVDRWDTILNEGDQIFLMPPLVGG